MEHVEHFAHSTQMRARYMHNPHQRADDSMIVEVGGGCYTPWLVGLSAIAYAEHT